MNVVYLDAGHAWSTAGKRAPDGSMLEWEFNNNMQHLIKPRLEAHGIKVVLVNPHPESGTEVGLSARANRANDSWYSDGRPNGLYVSLHSNAHLSDQFTSARGVEVYLASNGTKESRNAASILDRCIYQAGKAMDAGFKDRGVKVADFTVIYKAAMPSILIEYAFYSNREDLYLLKNKRPEFAEATVKGLCEYFNIAYKPGGGNVNPPTNGNNNVICIKKVTGASTLNVRQSNTTASAIVGTLKEGDRVEVYQENCDGFDRINFGGQQRYAGTKYLVKVEDVKPPTTGKTYYRVSCGSYGVRSNAVDKQNKLKSHGIDSFLAAATVDGKTVFRVIAGSYSNRDEANKQMNRIKALGPEFQDVDIVIYHA